MHELGGMHCSVMDGDRFACDLGLSYSCHSFQPLRTSLSGILRGCELFGILMFICLLL